MILFAEHGYAHTSIRKIAARAGVSTGLLYHYFSSKESLLTTVFDNTMQILGAGFAGADEVDGPLEKLTYLLRYIFDTLHEDRTYWGLFQSLRSQPAVMSVLGENLRLWTGHLRDLFVALLAEAGRETPDIDAYLLYSLIEGTIQQYLLDPENYPLELVAERILSQFGTP